jgi:hypothetical protein
MTLGQQAVWDNVSIRPPFSISNYKTLSQISISMNNFFHNFVFVLFLSGLRVPTSLSFTRNCPRIGQHTEALCPRAFMVKCSDIYLIHKSERNIRISVINHFCSFRWMKLRQRKNETIFKRKDEFRDASTYITLLVGGWLVLQCITWPI